MILLIMGAAGAGKTTVGRALAEALGWRFYDADDFHSPQNIAKMAHGIPLQDADRWPWLERLRELLKETLAQVRSAVLACSALKASYRQYLTISPDIRLVYLKAGRELLLQRLSARHGHYMKADMLESQLQALEEPADGLTVDASLPPETIVEYIRQKLGV